MTGIAAGFESSDSFPWRLLSGISAVSVTHFTLAQAMTSLPTIAIVGRPNVGKSTLFNRLTGTRAALVSDHAGPDARPARGRGRLGGHRMSRSSTPPGSRKPHSGSIAARMRKQSEKAIAEADLVLFVIDARAGVTPADEVFAQHRARLRASRSSWSPTSAKAAPAESGFYEAF